MDVGHGERRRVPDVGERVAGALQRLAGVGESAVDQQGAELALPDALLAADVEVAGACAIGAAWASSCSEALSLDVPDCPTWLTQSKEDFGAYDDNRLRCSAAATDGDAARRCDEPIASMSDAWEG